MEKFTQCDFQTLSKDNNGLTHCPTGDYRAISIFPDFCLFQDGCIFGENSIFGEGCSFGELCIFGSHCSFGIECSFDKLCSFGDHCYFVDWCVFGDRCILGAHSQFGVHCKFGNACSFGVRCKRINPKQEKKTHSKVKTSRLPRIGDRVRLRRKYQGVEGIMTVRSVPFMVYKSIYVELKDQQGKPCVVPCEDLILLDLRI